MIFIIAFIVIVIITIVALIRSEKPAKHIFAEAKYEFTYNVIGSKALLEDFMAKKQNKTTLLKKPGKTAVITGGTRGIGAEVIRMLLQCDINVIMGCRDLAAGENLFKTIREEEGLLSGDLKLYYLDISSLESVKGFSKVINAEYTSINYLINNAGIMYVPYAETEDGFESQFATNYLGHYLLTHLLMPLIRKAGKEGDNSRIINVASCAYLTGTIDFEDINKKNMFISFEAYSQSKLAQILFTNYLEDMLKKENAFIQVHAIHPGIVNTGLFDGTYVKTMLPFILPLIFKSPEEGAISIVHACISEELEGKGGTYISNCKIMPLVTENSTDKELQQKLFDFSKKLVKIEHFGSE